MADARMAAIIAGVLAKRGVDGFVFRGNDGLDELTTTTTSQVWAIVDGVVTEHELDATELGIARSQPDDLRGGDVAFNVDVVRRLLAGEQGPVRDAVLLNAAAGIAAYDTPEAAGGTPVDRMRPALSRAAEAVDSGAAGRNLDAWLAAVAR